jgi:hypothetical protein
MKLKQILFTITMLSVTGAFSQPNFIKFGGNSITDTGNSYQKTMGDGFIGFGFVLGSSNAGAKVNYGESREFIVGIGSGYRFVKWNGLGLDLYYKSTNYFLAQDSGKILPNNTLYKSEKITLDNFGGLAFDRFYFGKFFIDGGFYFDWTFYTKHTTWNNNYAFAFGSVTKVIEKQLDFTNSTNYGLTFRLGKTQGLSFYFNYRLTKVFKDISPQGFSYPDLPIYVLGITIGGHM